MNKITLIKDSITAKFQITQDNIQKVLRKNTTAYYISFLVVVAGLLVFFLTSKLFLPDDTALKNTEIGKAYTINSATQIILEDWTYSDINKLMLIEISVTDTFLNYDYDFNFEAVSRKDPFKKLDLKVVYNDKNSYFIAIENLPKDYHAVSLKVIQKSKINGTETKLKLYQDYRKMKVDNTKAVKTADEYAVLSVKNEIGKVIKSKDDIQLEIENLNLQILNIDEISAELHEEKKFKTAQEIQQIDSLIIAKENEKISLQKKIDEQHSTLLLTEEKLIKLNEKLTEFQQSQPN